MVKFLNIGERVTPKFNFNDYKVGQFYVVLNKKPDKIFSNVYNLYCEQTKKITSYPCMFADVRFIGEEEWKRINQK